ncbi:external alternative NAD(P)H-ubiquinone oxidoreductase B1, mitochondrial-like [Impatiens glandulifera]|uniref:external alternative NAD(P)H-ubiquinone oxidoreductase B1, mitochondrial-like n=1 Tax=Impatiens glandulifera TaxID=253017 RepID=UPI001FB19D15|nr:external alternative NAD(P)H-ubiquinone oxidoreductase B1, mitochondrial-like [Impatiens glandulifera]
MRIFSQLSKLINDHHSSYSKLLILLSVSGSGGLIAYSQSNKDGGNPRNIGQNQRDQKKKRIVVLGTGWAGISFLKDIDTSAYNVQVVSPRNYFAFTPLLPSVTCGTVEARSIVEPIRNIMKKRSGEFAFWEAECLAIDSRNKRIHCRSNIKENLVGSNDFSLEYDYLIIALGAQVNTYDTPGVLEHCHFLKELEDAQMIRRSVIDCFEKAVLPDLSDEERRTNLHFVIVGGGPTGVEFAAELHDFFVEDVYKLYPSVRDLVKITIIQSGDHILNTFDARISSFAEQKFQRDGIHVITGSRVMSVSNDHLNMKTKADGKDFYVPHGMVVWSTGIGSRPVVKDFMKTVDQNNRRVLATDEWLRVTGCKDVYAIGDCATVTQRRVKEDILNIFESADEDNSGTLTVDEFRDATKDILIRYPQVQLYLKNNHITDATHLLKDKDGNEIKELTIEQFKTALCQVDSQTKSLPATAAVAAQQGEYLSSCFNRRKICELNPEGPRRFRSSGRHTFRPFCYKHLGQFAPLGGEQAAAELPGDWVSMGHSTQWLWYSVYASKQVSWRTRILVVSDWVRRFIFGRDSSGI